MILESEPWRKELMRQCRSLEAGCRASGEAADFRISRSLVYTATVARMMFDRLKVPQQLRNNPINIIKYSVKVAPSQNLSGRLGGVDIDEWFDLENGDKSSVTVQDSMNYIIHCRFFAFECNDLYEVKFVYVSSEYIQDKMIVRFAVELYLSIVRMIARERLKLLGMRWDNGRPKVETN